MEVCSDKSKILGCSDIQYSNVPCPEWGCTVRVRSLTNAERDEYEESLLNTRSKHQKVNMKFARAKLLVRCCVKEDNSQLFDETDLMVLGRKSAKPVDRLFSVAQKLSGISDEDIEELTKNS